METKFKELEKSKQDASKKHDIQLTALNQNLATLRAELKQNNEKQVSAEANINLLKSASLGESCQERSDDLKFIQIKFLELEAQLEANSAEKNTLLKRCIDAENSCDSLKGQINESKRKIEDLKAALQDLGREHESLQVLINSVNSISKELKTLTFRLKIINL